MNRTHEASARSSTNLGSSNLSILLIEDNPLDAEVFAMLLARSKEANVEIQFAESLAEAKNQLENYSPDLVVLDLNLKGSFGIDTFKKLKVFCKAPIIVYSGEDDDTITQEAVKTGAQDYILKGGLDSYTLMRSIRFAVERFKRTEADSQLARHHQELHLLHEIQEDLLPNLPNQIFRNLCASAVIHPAERASGDCCDIIRVSDSKFLCFVADVAGHGLSASQLMLTVRATIRAITKYTSDPAEILLAADGLLRNDFRDGQFVTVFICEVDADHNTISFASAAHTAHVLSRTGEVVTLKSDCLPIGVLPLEREQCRTEQIPFLPDEQLFIATDGLIETQNANNQFFGEKNMVERLHQVNGLSPEDTIIDMLQFVSDFRGNSVQHDDITCLCVKYRKNDN